MIWFTSDTHYFHKYILNYRKFSTVEEMNDCLIANYNAVVGKDDWVYHLGDFAFAKENQIIELFDRLNGNVVLLSGNHDRWIRKLKRKPVNLFGIENYIEFKEQLDGITVKFCLFHYPIDVWNGCHHGSYMLHGHEHGDYRRSVPRNFARRIIDVGVDCWDYKPISIDMVHDKLKSLPFSEHHGKIGEPRI